MNGSDPLAMNEGAGPVLRPAKIFHLEIVRVGRDGRRKSRVTDIPVAVHDNPAKADGAWSARLPAGLSKEPVRLDIKQQITRITGSARVGGNDLPLEDARMRGERLSFKLAMGGRSYDFTGTVKGRTIEGLVEGGGTKGAWSAAPTK